MLFSTLKIDVSNTNYLHRLKHKPWPAKCGFFYLKNISFRVPYNRLSLLQYYYSVFSTQLWWTFIDCWYPNVMIIIIKSSKYMVANYSYVCSWLVSLYSLVKYKSPGPTNFKFSWSFLESSLIFYMYYKIRIMIINCG